MWKGVACLIGKYIRFCLLTAALPPFFVIHVDPRTGKALDILLATNYNATIFALVSQCSGVLPISCQLLRTHDEFRR
jgi:hypothetical protein